MPTTTPSPTPTPVDPAVAQCENAWKLYTQVFPQGLSYDTTTTILIPNLPESTSNTTFTVVLNDGETVKTEVSTAVGPVTSSMSKAEYLTLCARGTPPQPTPTPVPGTSVTVLEDSTKAVTTPAGSFSTRYTRTQILQSVGTSQVKSLTDLYNFTTSFGLNLPVRSVTQVFSGDQLTNTVKNEVTRLNMR